MQTKIVLLLFGCLIGLALAASHSTPAPVPSTSCYIATDGVDANNTCSASSPCKTIARCFTLTTTNALDIYLGTGTYGPENCGVTLTSNYSYASVSITGLLSIINCGDSMTKQFSFSGMPNTVVTINNLTLASGNGGDGGCVSATNVKQLNINNVLFHYCVGDRGGALYTNSIAVITSSHFLFNTATGGGALYLETTENGTAISDSYIYNNTAGQGAGIFLNGDYLYISSSNISSNTATSYGGGIYIVSPTVTKVGKYEFMNSNFTNNNALLGGGLYAQNLNHTWNVYGALFTDNVAQTLDEDSNIACNQTAPKFCYGCTASDCVTGCLAGDGQSCSQNSTSATTKTVLCYGSVFTMCSDVSCKCKAPMSTVEKILIVAIIVLLVVGVVLIAVDVVRFFLKKRQQSSTYTPIQ